MHQSVTLLYSVAALSSSCHLPPPCTHTTANKGLDKTSHKDPSVCNSSVLCGNVTLLLHPPSPHCTHTIVTTGAGRSATGMHQSVTYSCLYSVALLPSSLPPFGTCTLPTTGSEILTRMHQSVTFLSLFCLLYTSPSPRDSGISRMPSSA